MTTIDKKYIEGIKKSYSGYYLQLDNNKLRIVNKAYSNVYGMFPNGQHVLTIPKSLIPKVYEWIK